ncbi:hypothetical protein SEA_FRANCOB_230 [Streptomyces phage Francob]
MPKRWIYGSVALLTGMLLVMVILLNGDSRHDKFDTYKEYAKQVNVVDWSISEDTAKSFAEANCDKLAVGEMPAIKFRSADHVKSSAAVLAAYCPDSFDNFLAGIIIKYPEYKDTATYINERLEVDSH